MAEWQSHHLWRGNRGAVRRYGHIPRDHQCPGCSLAASGHREHRNHSDAAPVGAGGAQVSIRSLPGVFPEPHIRTQGLNRLSHPQSPRTSSTRSTRASWPTCRTPSTWWKPTRTCASPSSLARAALFLPDSTSIPTRLRPALTTAPRTSGRSHLQELIDTFMKVWNLPKPVIAAVNGYALGGALRIGAGLRRQDCLRPRDVGRTRDSRRIRPSAAHHPLQRQSRRRQGAVAHRRHRGCLRGRPDWPGEPRGSPRPVDGRMRTSRPQDVPDFPSSASR